MFLSLILNTQRYHTNTSLRSLNRLSGKYIIERKLSACVVVCSVSFYYKLIDFKKIKIMGMHDTTEVIVQCEFEVFGHVQGAHK